MRWWLAVIAFAACTGVQPRFPDDLQTALAHAPMRRLETDHFIIYYAAPKRAEVDRFLARANRCAEVLRGSALIRTATWADKMVIVMPDVAFNNAFVLPDLGGYEPVSVIPLQATLDFATEFGLPPDPGYIACHELVHYVHDAQIAGFWSHLDSALGHLYTPQIGYDPWFFEGLATHYEAALSPGVGRPRWPIFTGMFAAAYAGEHVGGGDLSSLGRLASVGHHYLVGAMFVRFLTERYGERPLWTAIADEASAITGWFFAGTFKTGFGVSFAQLIDEFDAWHARVFPARARPATQRRLAVLGNDARYARGRDGTEAWVGEDVDVPPRLHVRDSHGRELADVPLVEIMPPRKLVQASPLLVSGMSISDAGDVWLTVIDLGATFQIPRTLRWSRAGGLAQVADDLGPGAAIDPGGRVYYYCWVDGDAWSLAAYDVATHARRMIVEAKPGTYVLSGQVSPDGARVVANVWDGHAFVAWVIDVASGEIVRRIGGDPSSPVWDASFTSDGRVMWLGEVAERFQVIVEGKIASDAPYAALAPREAGGTIRFMDREGWEWELAEIATPPTTAAYPSTPEAPPTVLAGVPASSDEPASIFDHLFYPQERSPTLLLPSSGSIMIGGVLGGGDRLGLQRWSLAGYLQPAIDPVKRTHYGTDIAYLNAMLAPVLIVGELSVIDWADQVNVDPSNPSTKVNEERRTRDASLSLVHTYRGTLGTSLGGIYTDDYSAIAGAGSLRVHVAGPQLSLFWESAETTRYTEERRALIANATVAEYPHALSTFEGDITDVGGALGGFVPLPLGRRHRMLALVRGRALIAPVDTGLLQVGGDSGLATIWNGSSSSTTPPSFDTTRFPPNLRFVEPLRGYEDYAITTDRAALADLVWRYPIIVDQGVATTLRVLPASFLRELDVELFGAGALDRAGNQHVAAGGALLLRVQLLRIPLIITYQLARRLVDDRAVTQLVGVGPGP